MSESAEVPNKQRAAGKRSKRSMAGQTQAEQLLKQSEERFRMLIENSSDIISVLARDATIIYESPSVKRILGYKPGEVLGKNVFEFIHPDDVPRVSGLRDALQQGQEVTQEFLCRKRHKNGSWRFIEGIGKIWTDKSGEVIGIFNSRDVTARMQTEEALRLEQQRLRLAQAVAGIGTWEWETIANRVTWSENMGPLFGRPKGFSPGTREAFRDLVVPEDRGGIAESVRRTFDEDAPFEVRFRTVWPDGTEHWLTAKGSLFREEHGRPLKLLGAAMDITERMKTEQAREAELNRTRDELRALTMNLVTAQEDERRRIARELHDDILQRLARFQIELDILRRRPPDDPAESSNSMQSLAQQITEISGDLRRLSHRLHSGVIEDLGLEVGLRSLVEDFQHSVHLNATLVSEGVPRELPMPIAMTLYRITQEALQNVKKHAPGANVSIRLSKFQDGLRLFVNDNGPGFDPVAARGKPGLGIISMQERAKLVGGSLVVRSRPGDGSEIEVMVPLEPGIKQNRPRLLIVDDDAEVRRVLRHIVQKASCEVVGEAEHGKLAISLAEELHPDIIVLDVNMPVMGGFPAARELRRRLPHARVVFVSQHSNQMYISEAFSCGASAYVLKSSAATELPKAIHAAMVHQ
jgi:PAS domain S-box-containing protein